MDLFVIYAKYKLSQSRGDAMRLPFISGTSVRVQMSACSDSYVAKTNRTTSRKRCCTRPTTIRSDGASVAHAASLANAVAGRGLSDSHSVDERSTYRKR